MLNLQEELLFLMDFIPAGLTEAVQDIVGDSSFTRAGLGMSSVEYNDSSNTHTFTNTGIRGFTAGNTQLVMV
jgi:hypothetical protein